MDKIEKVKEFELMKKYFDGYNSALGDMVSLCKDKGFNLQQILEFVHTRSAEINKKTIEFAKKIQRDNPSKGA